jgi:ABC-type Fe3+-hydroxamate transport system substrate-binding protein
MEKRTFVDQMGRSVEVPFPPKRIISLVPSQTELLYDLGLEEEVVGITKFCIYPDEWFRNKQRIGGTKQLKLDEILALKPDLVIGNKEENTKADIDFLIQQNVPVWMSDIFTYEEALEMIEQIGKIANKEAEANDLLNRIETNFNKLGTIGEGKSALYFIWDEPSFVVGKSTFIDSLLTKIGFENTCKLNRYPDLTELENPNPDFVFLSSEPFPFKEEHLEKYQKRFPNAKVMLVDGELFSWYGSRMELAPAYFESLI